MKTFLAGLLLAGFMAGRAHADGAIIELGTGAQSGTLIVLGTTGSLDGSGQTVAGLELGDASAAGLGGSTVAMTGTLTITGSSFPSSGMSGTVTGAFMLGTTGSQGTGTSPSSPGSQGSNGFTGGSTITGTFVPVTGSTDSPFSFDVENPTFNLGDGIGTFTFTDATFTEGTTPGTFNIQLAATPEPSTWLLLSVSLLGFAVMMRRIPARA